jgi:putative PIN family toxin of toxin-antitoxin system
VQRKPKNPPIAVLDTNVLISYLLGSKVITLLIDSLDNNAFIPAISPYLETEFLEVMRRPRIAKIVNPGLAAEFMEDWINFALYVKPVQHVTICRDPDDNAVLECALAAAADFIVTGDFDLLTLHSFGKIPIITPGDFVRDILKID